MCRDQTSMEKEDQVNDNGQNNQMVAEQGQSKTESRAEMDTGLIYNQIPDSAPESKEKDQDLKLGLWNYVQRKSRAKNQGGKSSHMGREKTKDIQNLEKKVVIEAFDSRGPKKKLNETTARSYSKPGPKVNVLDPTPKSQKAQDSEVEKGTEFAFKGGPPSHPTAQHVRNPFAGKSPQSGNKGKDMKGKATSVIKKKYSPIENQPDSATPKLGKNAEKKPVFDMENFRILQRQHKDSFKSSFCWKNPLDEAAVAVDEETLAFAEKQRNSNSDSRASSSRDGKEGEMELDSQVKAVMLQGTKETASHLSEEMSQ